MDFSADTSAPSSARRFVSDHLQSMAAGWPRDDVVLVVSELVTNSVQAGAQAISVQVHITEGRLQLQVTDDAEGSPTPRSSQPTDLRGRGLAISASLADDLAISGIHPLKVVTASWFDQRA